MTKIIKADMRNLEEAALLFDAYRQFYKQSADLSKAKEFVRERLSQQDSVIFLAYNNGEAAGFTQLYPAFSSVQMKRTWILNDLYVAPKHRQKGVAESLMQSAKFYAEETGSAALTLQTATDNVNAQALYEKLDYQRVTTFYQYRLGID